MATSDLQTDLLHPPDANNLNPGQRSDPAVREASIAPRSNPSPSPRDLFETVPHPPSLDIPLVSLPKPFQQPLRNTPKTHKTVFGSVRKGRFTRCEDGSQREENEA